MLGRWSRNDAVSRAARLRLPPRSSVQARDEGPGPFGDEAGGGDVPQRQAAVLHERVEASARNVGEGEGGAASTDETTMATSPEALEEEAGQEGAFNPETGEINWDCPCLGGMANGPFGEEFKTAFSCFVFSKEEPKGMDCIEKFQ